MGRRVVIAAVCVGLSIGVLGCGDDSGGGGALGSDAGADASIGDTGARDASGGDTGASDASGSDVGAPDTGGADTGGADTGGADTGAADTGAAADTTPVPDTGSSSGVGGPCQTAADCADANAVCWTGDDGFPGGYCLVEGCGDSAPCPDGSSCWRFQDDETRCLDNCQARQECRAGYLCDADGTCWPGETCTAGSCGAGQRCDEPSGQCVIDLGQPPAGSPPDCSHTVSWECTGTPAYCAELDVFDPRSGDGWWDYPLNGETAQNQYRSWLRRDAIKLVEYAAAKVACKADGWPGNGGLLGLGDMSEANGDIPGTSDGDPGHPAGTHVDGFDIDIAYYQTNTSDNRLRPVCDHHSGGQDAYHCVAEPDRLDVWRTALFLAHLHDAVIDNRFQMRVVGVDGRIGPLVESAIDQLCQSGWYSGPACSQKLLAYEVSDEGRGWYYFHHHHLHVSTNGLHPDASSIGAERPAAEACLSPGCRAGSPQGDPRRHLDYAH